MPKKIPVDNVLMAKTIANSERADEYLQVFNDSIEPKLTAENLIGMAKSKTLNWNHEMSLMIVFSQIARERSEDFKYYLSICEKDP